jgi:hypothetical protein
MAEEFKFTENSARSVVNSQMDKVKTRQRIDEAHAAGANPVEVTRAAMGDDEDVEALGKGICVVALFSSLGKVYGLKDPCDREEDEPLENMAFLGYAALLQHYVDSEPAKRFSAFFNSVETNGDALRFFLDENKLEDDVIRYHKDYEHDFFEEWKSQRLSPQFALNRADYDAQVERVRKNNKEAEEQLKKDGYL